jgi:peptidoglycan/xylan/chitin deacetylase (PgdA/CDA1 family)
MRLSKLRPQHWGLIACGLLLPLLAAGFSWRPPAQPIAPTPTLLPPATAVAAAPTTPLTPTTPPTLTPTPLPTTAPTPTRVPSAWYASRYLPYVPILMYHYVRVVDEAEDPLGYGLSVAPDRFAEQMAWVRATGYTPMRMDDLVACLREIIACPEQPVVLTFDDGYEECATVILPILQRHNITATFYIVPGLVGQPGYMSWEHVEELHHAGMEIGSHTVTHADLSGLSLDAAREEIVRSKALLEEAIGAPVYSFSYPAGNYTQALLPLIHEAGYTSAVAIHNGGDFWRLYKIPRRRVLGGETIDGFPWYFQAP